METDLCGVCPSTLINLNAGRTFFRWKSFSSLKQTSELLGEAPPPGGAVDTRVNPDLP